MALLVDLLIEHGRSAICPTLVLAVADLISWLRDRARDATSAHVGARARPAVWCAACLTRSAPTESRTGRPRTEGCRHAVRRSPATTAGFCPCSTAKWVF